MGKPVTYVPRPMGTIEDDGKKYLQAELASVSQSVKTIVAELAKINDILARHGLS